MATSNDAGLEKILVHTLKDGTKVFRVTGRYVRDNIHGDFTEGGHGYVYNYIPKDEIWVEKMLDLDDEEENLAHELIEYCLMKYGKMDYDTAHDHAIEMEVALRKIPDPRHPEKKKTESVLAQYRRLVG